MLSTCSLKAFASGSAAPRESPGICNMRLCAQHVPDEVDKVKEGRGKAIKKQTQYGMPIACQLAAEYELAALTCIVSLQISLLYLSPDRYSVCTCVHVRGDLCAHPKCRRVSICLSLSADTRRRAFECGIL